jgi:transposase
MILRRYTFKLYVTAAQEAALREQLLMMGQLWNALLQRREDVYRREGRTLGKRDQYKEITALRAECPEWAALSVAAARGVADRLDKAFKAFFQRAKKGAGAQSGYPRYKRADRWSSISFTEACGSGWNISRANVYAPQSSKPAGGWLVYVKGIPGQMKARGRLPAAPLDWRTGEILLRDGAWWLSVAVEMPCRRKAGTERITISFDLIDEFARVERVNGESLAGSQERITPSSPRHSSHPGAETLGLRGDENSLSHRGIPPSGADIPGLSGDENVIVDVVDHGRGADTPALKGDENKTGLAGQQHRGADTPGLAGDENIPAINVHGADTPGLRGDENKDQLEAIQSACDRRFRKFSYRWRREKQRVARKQAYMARANKHAHHLWSTNIVRHACDLTVVAPTISEWIASPRGDERHWGANVKTVSHLNRHVLGQAPALAIAMLQYKAEEAGIRCDIVKDEKPNIAVGQKLVKAGKTLRRVRRALKRKEPHGQQVGTGRA